jgi:hypothetical protein
VYSENCDAKLKVMFIDDDDDNDDGITRGRSSQEHGVDKRHRTGTYRYQYKSTTGMVPVPVQ